MCLQVREPRLREVELTVRVTQLVRWHGERQWEPRWSCSRATSLAMAAGYLFLQL